MGFDFKKYNKASGDWMTFSAVGDSITGTVTSIYEAKDFNGNPCPELLIETDDGPRKVTAGQVMLQSALAETEPDEGDAVTITYYGNGEPKPGKAAAKLFKVEVKRGGAVGADDLV